MAVQALCAFATELHQTSSNVVADFKFCDVRANCGNYAGDLVTKHSRWWILNFVAHFYEIRAAQPRRLELNQDFLTDGLSYLNVFFNLAAAEFSNNHGFHRRIPPYLWQT